jgi:hypothetical protein
MAQKGRTALQTDIDTNLADNNVEAITPALHREVETNLNDSAYNLDDNDSDDVTEGATNLFFTDTRVYTKVKALLAAGTNVTITADDGAQTLTIDAATGGVSDGDKGDVTVSSSGTVWTIDNDAVTFDKIQNIPTNRVLARSSSGTGSVESLTLPNFRTLINVEDGADVTDTTNVTAAGALMDSEVVNLNDVKNFDPADYATAAQGTTADNALPTAGGTMTGAILGDQEIRGHRPVGSPITTSDNLENIDPNTYYPMDSSGGAVVITVTDAANSAYAQGVEFEFSPNDLTNDISFTVSGSQVINSKDGNLKIDGNYSGVVLKKEAANTWKLIGSLKA